MSKFSKLLAQVDLFWKLASSDLDKFIRNHQAAMKAEFSGGVRAIDKLNNSNSPGLKPLYNSFIKLNSFVDRLNDGNVSNTKNIVDQMLNEVGQASFYTSPGNAGTGYDPLLTQGGPVSPAAYLNRAKTHLDNLNTYLQKVQPAKPAAMPVPTNIA